MNWLDLLLFFSSAQGIMLGIVLIAGGITQRSRKVFLGLFLFSFSFVVMGWVGYWTGFNQRHPWAMGWPQAFIWLLGPALWGFYRSDALVCHTRDIWHLLPFLIQLFFISQFVAYHIDRPDLLVISDAFGLFLKQLNPYMGFIMVIGMLVYLVIILKRLNVRAVSISWRQTPALFAFGIFILGTATYHTVQFNLGYYMWFDYALSLIMVVSVYVFSYRSQAAFLLPENDTPKYAGSSLTDTGAQHLVDKIKRHLKNEQSYLDPSYSLDRLADELHTPKYRISQALNAYAGISFNELVNTLRAQKAEGMLRNLDYEHYKIEAIGQAAGFNNRVTFNTYFKQIFGISPGKYRRQCQQESEVK